MQLESYHTHRDELIKTINYVICEDNLALKHKPNLLTQGAQLHLSGIADNDYAGDRNTTNRVYGYVIYFCGLPIAWKSYAGKSITLSSTETE
jgi:hypothetical protein